MNWWLWNSWVEEPDGSTRPFYGFLAKTFAPVGVTASAKLVLPSKAILNIAEKVIAADDASPIASSVADRSSHVDLTRFFANAPIIELQAYRQILCTAFGHSAARSTCGYSHVSPEDLFPRLEDIEVLVTHCTQQLGLPFRSSHAIHLGGFDLYQLDHWLDGPSPYGASVLNQPANESTNLIRVWRSPVVDQRQIVHLRAMAEDEVLHDGLHYLELGVSHLDAEISSPVDAYELSIFDEVGGILRYRESTAMLMQVELASHTFGRVVQHRDRVEAKAALRGKSLHERAASTASVHTVRSSVNFDALGFRRHRNALRAKLNEVFPPASSDHWFPRTAELGLGVIAHLDRMLAASRTCEAIIVDPFFGEEALQTVATRLTNADLRLTVVASWGRSDPDTGVRVDGTSEYRQSYAKRRLEPVLDKIGPLISVQFRFVNIVTNEGLPAFHDRYLLLKSHDGSSELYLLSNSLNALATNWPFCMSQLGGRAKVEATRYVEGLANGKDVTQTTNPTTSFDWASPRFHQTRAQAHPRSS